MDPYRIEKSTAGRSRLLVQGRRPQDLETTMTYLFNVEKDKETKSTEKRKESSQASERQKRANIDPPGRSRHYIPARNINGQAS
jgi:septum formation inhibitor MinC